MASAASVSVLGTTESYLRTAALSIFIFDFLETIPQEIAFYRREKNRFWRPRGITLAYAGCRYCTLVYLCMSEANYFARGNFGFDACKGWVIVSSLLRLFGSVFSGVIFIWRTNAFFPQVSVKIVLWSLMLVDIAIACIWIFGAVLRSTPSKVPNSCLIGLNPILPAYLMWIPYIIFDLICFVLVFIKLRELGSLKTWTGLPRLLFRGSLGYILAATLLNSGNLAFYALPIRLRLTTTMSSLSAGLIAILSQRIVLSVHAYRPDHKAFDTISPAIGAPMQQVQRRPSDAYMNTPQLANIPVLLQRDVHAEVHSAQSIDHPAYWRADGGRQSLLSPETDSDKSPSLPPFQRADSVEDKEEV